MEALIILQIVLSSVLIISILLQRGNSGLGTVFGGNVADAYRTKRGFEAFVYNLTIFTSILFVACSLAIVVTTA